MFDIREIYQPKSLREALALAARHPQAVIIAGGTDVLIKIREGKLSYRELLSIRGLKELRGVEENADGDLLIGPLNSFRDIQEHSLVCRHIPILAQAAATVGGPQIRVMGTVGGNVANGVTSADTSSSLHTLEAELLLQSTTGQRLLPIKDFYTGPGQTAREPQEILTKIIIRHANYAESGGCYIKYAMREAMDIATLGCAILVKPDKAGQRIARIRIAFGVAAPVPMRCLAAEAELTGLRIAPAVQRVAELVRAEINPRDSWRAPREFRLHIAGVLAERALVKAWQQALERRR
ncbi:MAG: xanthine dehydrogenase FAD-binding subunit XdhB [Clostridiales bacterium]|nr:xanthine dehydrogenase FAD-binding subunit XdhB [Clostridiales bacterium]